MFFVGFKLTKRLFFRLLVYFRRGYGLYGVFLSALNTANILILVLSQVFHVSVPHTLMIVALILMLVIMVMAVIGYWDFRRGQREQEVVLHVRTDPIATSFNELAVLNNRINSMVLRVLAKHLNEPALAELANLLDNELNKRLGYLSSIGYALRDYKEVIRSITLNQHDSVTTPRTASSG